MRIPVSIRMSRSSNSHRPDTVSLEITDEISGSTFAACEMSLMQFASLLTNLGAAARCDFMPTVVGMVSEHKQELVPVPCAYGLRKREEVARQAVAPFEVDGWKARLSDATNHHRSVGDRQDVTFHRHVPLNAENVEALVARFNEYSRDWPQGYTADDLRKLAAKGPRMIALILPSCPRHNLAPIEISERTRCRHCEDLLAVWLEARERFKERVKCEVKDGE